MAAKPVRIDIALVFQTPPSIAAAGARQSIADRVVERNAKGEFIIPGSQVKGKLRHACEQFLRATEKSICAPPRAETMCPPGLDKPCLLCQIFGGPAYPSPLKFSDLFLDLGNENPDRIHSIPSLRAMTGMNRRRATVAEGRLFLVETAPYFPELRFYNEEAITGTLENLAQVKLLLAGLKLIPAWGGMKSRGLGWIARRVDNGRIKVELEVSAFFNGKPVEMADWQEVRRLWSD
jgi:CRISPR/Cas system CSM-associated protein Csm3 (group 7 of RAMP superfamily)